jgi:N-acetylmuramoyl-L-alanine amidase
MEPTHTPSLDNGSQDQVIPTEPAVRPWKILQTIITVAVVVATMLTFWTPRNLFAERSFDSIFQFSQPDEMVGEIQPTTTPSSSPRIGLVAGHWGHDSGTVCSDGLTEESVNLDIATRVKEQLTEAGYEVDLMQEFDRKLFEYQASVLISIHNDSCEYINDEATGFKVAAAIESVFPEAALRLTNCLASRYQSTTGLRWHANTITPDMTTYHAFQEIHSQTPAAIIETGFMNLDRDVLTRHPQLVASGVTAGIICFLKNEPVTPLESTPAQ